MCSSGMQIMYRKKFFSSGRQLPVLPTLNAHNLTLLICRKIIAQLQWECKRFCCRKLIFAFENNIIDTNPQTVLSKRG